jgi:hypothetical protein
VWETALEREPYGFLDAWLRYERAREHLADVNELIERFKTTPQEVDSHIEADLFKFLTEHKEVDRMPKLPIPYDIPIRVGEVLYNLRCALDYLVFALAWHDSGIEPTGRWAKNLQFLIESDPQLFESRVPTRLEGLSDIHIAAIRECQPGYGCAWTGLLAELNDSDKHRHLGVLAGSLDADAEVVEWIANMDELEAMVQRGLMPEDDEVDVKLSATFDIVFPNGSLVTETLEELESEVGALLTAFAGEFYLRPV